MDLFSLQWRGGGVFSCGGNRVFHSYFLKKNEELDKSAIYQDTYSCGICIQRHLDTYI